MDLEVLQNERYLRPVWSLWTVMISSLAVNRSDGIIRNPAFPTATPFVTRDILHFWRKLGINIYYPRRQEAPCRLVLHWADIEAMERVSGTAGLGELGKYN